MGIRNLGKEDIGFAVSLTVEEGWYYTPAEIELMLKLDPKGSFVYEEEEEPLGMATCVTYGRTGVLGHLIVSKKGRGRKIGHCLVDASVNYMEGKGAESILVNATEEAVKLYQNHGFAIRDVTSCMHSRLDSTFHRNPSADCAQLEKSDLPEVIDIDHRLFGDDRSRLIKLLYEESPEGAFKIERAGSIEGFIFGRPDHVGYNLGPWVCLTGDEKDAEGLFRTAVSTFDNGKIYMGAFMSNLAALRIADELPPISRWRIPMMTRGKCRYHADPSKVFGIAAYELG
jgi:N-acetylglutamate synthase-like GNAT family acetyltransferase